jgi:hypothetical protein
MQSRTGASGVVEFASSEARRGSVLLLATMSLFVLFGIMGLAVDLGWGYYRRQVAQAAADSAAIAGAVVAENANQNTTITCGVNSVACQAATACPANIVTPANNLQNACLYAKANGFQNAGNQTVTVASSANSGTIDPTVYNSLYSVTASVTETMPQLFSALQGHTYGTVAASATAQVVQLPYPYCIYALNPTVPSALSASGSNSVIDAPDCGIMVDSSSSTALSANGQAKITAGFIKIVGSYTSCNGGQNCTLTPTPHTGVAFVPDPLAATPLPAAPTRTPTLNPTCTDFSSQNYSNQGQTGTVFRNAGQCGQVSVSGQNAHVTLNPGYYCGGINIQGQANVTMNSGIYYMCGGGFQVQSAGTVVNGTGVIIFNSYDPAGGTAGYRPFLLTGQPNVTLSAPTSGTYANILFFRDPTVPTGAQEQINGQTQPTLTGTLYLPKGSLLLSGGVSTGPNNPAIIADTIQVNGGASIKTGTGSIGQFKFAALTQ